MSMPPATSLAAQSLLSLAVIVTAEQRVDSVLQRIVQGLASQPGVALARIWLVPSADLPAFYHAASDLQDHLCLFASAGTPINSPGEDWSFLQGHFARMPFNVGKVGQVATSRHPILVEDVTAQNEWVVRPEWAKREEIRSFAGHPLIFRDKLLGVIAVFSRQPLGRQEFTWLGLFANQAALAIANACAEEALQSSERNLRAIIDTIPTLAWTMLPDGSNEFLSKRWEEYTGLSVDESGGWGWQTAFHPDDLPALLKKWQKMLASGEAGEQEARLRRHDGVYRWFLIRAQAIRNDSGKIVRWYGTSTDIEDLKQAEQARRASERNLAAIINTVPTSAWTTRPDGYCDFVNQVWLDHAGMTAEQALGWGWAESIHPDDRKKLVEEWQSCLASGTPVDTEARIRRFDGSYRWFLIRANPLRDEGGNILKWYGTCVDIEDRKRGEETLRTRELSWRQIVDNIPGLVATMGPSGDVEFLNRQTLEYFGKTNEELKNWSLIGAVHPDDLPRVFEARKKSIESGQLYEVEHRCLRADGIYRWFQVRGLPVRDTENKITAWYLLLTDVEDRKQGEEALRARELDARSSLDNMPGFLGRHSPDGTPEIVNRPFLQYLGKTVEQIDEWRTSDLVHPDDLAHTIEAFRNGIVGGQPWGLEFRLRRFDGIYRWFQARWVPVRDVEGRILHWNALTTDIEDRKKAEEALQSRERNMSEIINAIPTSIGVMRDDGAPLYGNQAVTEYTGLTLEEMQRTDFRSRIFHPEDLERLREARRLAFARPLPFETEQRVLGKDGKYRWFLFRYKPVLDEAGKIDRWYMAAFEIEDRKRAEEALQTRELDARSLLDNMPGFLARVLPDGTPEFLNRPFLQYLGRTVGEIAKWRTDDIVHPDDFAHTVEVYGKAISTGQPIEFEYRLRRFDGVYRWFQVRMVPVRDVGGRILHWNALITDIEDRKRAEEALQSSERKLSLMINVIPTVIAVLGTDGSMLYANQTALDYTGLTLEHVQKEDSRSRIFHPQDVERLREERRASLTRGEPFENEQRVLGKDGRYRWFLIRYNPLLDEQGKIDRWYVAAADIEDRKRAEEALQSSERNLSLMINAIPAMVGVLRADGSLLDMNQTATDYLGVSREDLQKEDYRASVYHPEDLEKQREEHRLAFARPVPFEGEQRMLARDGRYRWFLTRYSPVLDGQGRIDRWYVAAFDIDDRKRAEAQVEQAYLRLAEAQRLSKTGSFITDLLGDDHDWSEEAFRIFEFDPGAKVTVQMIRNAIHPDDLPTFEGVIARGMTGTDVDFGFRIITSQGAVKHLRGMARVMAQIGGRPLFIGAFQDVTQSKLAEEALDKARSELAHVARIATLNALTASIAHEVNQPLSGIITNASTCRRMLDGNPPNIEGARETARRIIRDGNRASDVITRLRALFGKKDFTLEPLDLNEATREVIAVSLGDLQRNRVVLLSILAEDLPPVMGDRVQLQQVTLNLLRNASDAMLGVDDRPREVLVKTERDEGDRVRLSVVDAGIGFATEIQDKLFEAFYTTKNDGMGIGLAVSRSIIERHHGRLWAEPNAGPGATFSFSIPCAPCFPGSGTGATS
jgi:PAS domain S-box-containing protein